MAKGIWVFAEILDEKIKNVTFELLTAGRKIADQTGQELAAVLFGKDMAAMAGALGEYGADKIYLADDDKLVQYTTDAYSKVLATMIQEYDPSTVLMGCTVQGRDLAARVAQKVSTGLISDCTGVKMERRQPGIRTPPLCRQETPRPISSRWRTTVSWATCLKWFPSSPKNVRNF